MTQRIQAPNVSLGCMLPCCNCRVARRWGKACMPVVMTSCRPRRTRASPAPSLPDCCSLAGCLAPALVEAALARSALRSYRSAPTSAGASSSINSWTQCRTASRSKSVSGSPPFRRLFRNATLWSAIGLRLLSLLGTTRNALGGLSSKPRQLFQPRPGTLSAFRSRLSHVKHSRMYTQLLLLSLLRQAVCVELGGLQDNASAMLLGVIPI